MANASVCFFDRCILRTSHQHSMISHLEVTKDAVSSSWPIVMLSWIAYAYVSARHSWFHCVGIPFSLANPLDSDYFLFRTTGWDPVTGKFLFSLFIFCDTSKIFPQVSAHQTLLNWCLCSWHCLDRNRHKARWLGFSKVWWRQLSV